MKTYEQRTQAVLDGVERKKKNRRMLVALSTTASLCVVVLVMSLVLFLPYGTPATPGDSPYRAVIEYLSAGMPAYRNNFEKWSDAVGSSRSKGAIAYDSAANSANDAPMPNNAGSGVKEGSSYTEDEHYQENTNNQVEGVREGDLLKQSDNYFYYLRTLDIEYEGQLEPSDEDYYMYDSIWYDVDGDEVAWRRVFVRYRLQLLVYRKNGSDTQCVSTYTFAPANGYISGYAAKEMFLSDDCRTLTVVVDSVYHNGTTPLTAVMTLDLSDLQNIRVADEQYVTGDYLTARVSAGRLLLVTTYYARYYIDFDVPDTYIPYVLDDDSKIDLVDPDDIIIPETGYQAAYTVVTLFDGGEAIDQYALMGYSSTVYANGQRIYVTHDDWYDYDEEEGTNTTTVVCLSYGADGLDKVGQFPVNGSVLNQYSMDEYNGVFRVATSVSRSKIVADKYDDYQYIEFSNTAALYCYRVEDWKLIARVEDFAPQDETVRSARFVGDTAYICTAVQTRDPVFCFDLSDYDHITYTHTGEITGFSMSLTTFADDTLLGIGVDDNWDLKIELYRRAEMDMQSVDKAVLEYTSIVDEYKSYLINREYGLIGVPAWSWAYSEDGYADEYGCKYYLFAYADGQLRLVEKVAMESTRPYFSRAAIASDGYLYMFCDGWFTVRKVADLLAQ